MTLPNLFIVGAQKAGTTSLHAMLNAHPDVFMSDPKEPGYFIRGFDDPMRWQTLQRPTSDGQILDLSQVDQGIFTANDYAALFASTDAKIRGDASTPYLPSPHAATRIKSICPNARIVIALRDPVTRAYSAYCHNRARGNEPCATFAQAVAEERAGKRDTYIWGWRYLHAGHYADHVERYLAAFGDTVRIIDFAAFKADPQGQFDMVCDDLGIARHDISAQAHENASVQHDNAALGGARAAFTSPSKAKSLIKRLLPQKARNKIKKTAMAAIDTKGRKPDPLNPEMATDLGAYFQDQNKRLAQMTGMDIAHWTGMKNG